MDGGMVFNKIPAGTFMMGSPADETDRNDEDEYQHKVTISKAFYMQTTEVTQGQWKSVMGTEPWKDKKGIKEGDNYPASYVNSYDAIAYCKKLSEKEGKRYRLPTEAEWEYACRAGTQTKWSFGDDEKELGDYAWYKNNALDIEEMYAHQVGLKKPNAFGLYDMHGNAPEWCNDYMIIDGEDYYKKSPEKDPQGPTREDSRVLRGGGGYENHRLTRGGSWGEESGSSRSGSRSWIDAERRVPIGFRLVRELDDSTQSTPPPVPPTAPARESITNSIDMELNLIPAGTFTMGSSSPLSSIHSNKNQHKVTISKAFYMQTTEVTQRQWKSVMGTEPWKGFSLVKEGSNYAASCVKWDDAIAYCKKLSEKEDKTYRLPTEAEWEYACRAGTKTAWSFGDDENALGDYAWHGKNAHDIGEKYAHQVRRKQPNAFGLYDMHGNVYEWCNDYYGEDYYKQSPAQDPTGPASGSSRVLRGGAWDDYTRPTRSAYRDWFSDGAVRVGRDGFRVVRELD
jgi:formylglycine-generating enzyme required for sulfatase activity